MKILSVDDSRTVRLIVARAFGSYDVTMIEATNGVEGLDCAARENPDLILLDIVMPVMNGVTMFGRLREDPVLKTIPVVMLTAECGAENIAHIIQMGVRDYIMKPINEDQLVEKVSRIIPLRKRPVGT